VCPSSELPGAGAHSPAVRLVGIRRSFGAAVANDGIDLELAPATIHALVGENGAGKSTLMRILYGLVRPDRGRILIDGAERRIASPADALACGIGMMHQHFMLVPPMTVLENVILGYPGSRGLRTLPRVALSARLRELCAIYGLDLDPDVRVAELGVGERQRVEIARLLFHGARLLICDEPTAVLAPPEVDGLFRILRRFREEGRTVVLITHKLAEVLEVADRVTVLRRGRVVGEAARSAFDHDRLVGWIMGEERVPAAPATGGRRESVGEPALEARAITVRGGDGVARLTEASFLLAHGEILGIAGVQGNGQRELAEAVAGRRMLASGELHVGEVRVRPGQQMPVAVRPALLPEDRSSEGLLPGMTLWENLLLGHLGDRDCPWRRGYRHAVVRRWARPMLARFRVQPDDPDLPAEALSGGNQQKLLCAREFTTAARVLVASQPTRGIDIGSTRFLHDLLREYRAAGGSVLLISADLDEILALADRIAVLFRGRLSPPVERAAVDLEALGRAMVGIGGGAGVAP
jgi:ABC-type uncharacterized transport system ATPase subunit